MPHLRCAEARRAARSLRDQERPGVRAIQDTSLYVRKTGETPADAEALMAGQAKRDRRAFRNIIQTLGLAAVVEAWRAQVVATVKDALDTPVHESKEAV